MRVEVKNRYTDVIIFSGEYESFVDAIEINSANLVSANLVGANLGGANLRSANLGDANLRSANLGDANLGGAYLGDANLRGANLRSANLGDANLRGANLGDANLRGANLRDAYLGDANLPIVQIVGSKHYLVYVSDHITIGCEYHHVEYWRIMYEYIGNENNYTPEQIAEYKRYIDICTEIYRG